MADEGFASFVRTARGRAERARTVVGSPQRRSPHRRITRSSPSAETRGACRRDGHVGGSLPTLIWMALIINGEGETRCGRTDRYPAPPLLQFWRIQMCIRLTH